MITATPSPSFDQLVTQLANTAGQLAQAQVEEEARAAVNDPTRWREAGLLWPDFTASTTSKG
jgi:hypothetical protein